jgi:hypothetical protein
MIEAEFERIFHVVADRGDRTAERADEADLDRLLLRKRRSCDKREHGSGYNYFVHCRASLSRILSCSDEPI